MFADLVFRHGQVITVDKESRIAEAVAVKENRIQAVGTNQEINGLIGGQTKVVDLAGKSLLPGFIDAHTHITLHGLNKRNISCKEPHIRSLDDLFTDLRKKAQKMPKGQWVRAWGFNETKIAEQRYPSRAELDAVTAEHPIFIERACGHISVVNSLALSKAAIDDRTPDPEGGKIIRDRNGHPTGVLVETAQSLLQEFMAYSEGEVRKGLIVAAEDYMAAGITSIHDAGVMNADHFRIMHQAVLAGDVKLRIYAIVSTLHQSEQFVEKMMAAGITTGVGNEKFKIGPAKVYTDGSSSGPTLATREPYTSNPDDCGILYYSQEELNRILGNAHEAGFQITAHAQGDRAIEMLLNCIEAALMKSPRNNHRHRIEHAGITMPDLLERMRKLEVIPIPNPAFFAEYGDGYVKNYGDRVHHFYPVRDFIDQGIVAAGGSDNPVTTYEPLFGIHQAIHRISHSGQAVGPNQRISLMEAIRLFTWNGAYASFEEDIKGSIEPGKLADLVVLNKPILDVPPDEIKDLRVQTTVIDGKVVFSGG